MPFDVAMPDGAHFLNPDVHERTVSISVVAAENSPETRVTIGSSAGKVAARSETHTLLFYPAKNRLPRRAVYLFCT